MNLTYAIITWIRDFFDKLLAQVLMKKVRTPQSIIPTDRDRVKFKAKCKEALKDIEDEFGISFEFGRIDDCGGLKARMRVRFKKVKDPTLWDSPAAIKLVKAMRVARPQQ